jgi:hypothetical protein
VVYRFVPVCRGLLASSDGEVVELDIFEGVYFVEGVYRQSCLDPVADLEIWVEGVGLGFLLTDFLPFGSLRCSSASLPRWPRRLLPRWLSSPILLAQRAFAELSIPRGNPVAVVSSPGIFHLLDCFVIGEWLGSLVRVDNRLPHESPELAFKTGANSQGRIVNDRGHFNGLAGKHENVYETTEMGSERVAAQREEGCVMCRPPRSLKDWALWLLASPQSGEIQSNIFAPKLNP